MSAEVRPRGGKKPARSGASVKPVCAPCGRGMTIRQVTPVLFASNLDDVVFGCDACGAEIRRTVKRPDSG